MNEIIAIELMQITCIHFQCRGEILSQESDLTHDAKLDSPSIVKQKPNRKPTNKLLPHSISLPEVIRPEDESVDDAEEGDHIWHVICSLQLVHDGAEAVLLCLHRLKGKLKIRARNETGAITAYH